MGDTVSIAGLSKVAVLAALYNAAKPLGLGMLHYDPAPWTEAEAAAYIQQYYSAGGRLYFDYVKGRVVKCDLGGDEMRVLAFDRDNGQGAAAKAIMGLRTSNGNPLTEHQEASPFPVS